MSITFYAATFDTARNCYCFVENDDPLNVGNRNGKEICESLDLEFVDGCLDPIDIHDVINRCKVYLERVKDFDEPEIPSHVSKLPFGPTVIDCGRRENFLKSTIKRLLDDCEAGLRLNATHVYTA